MDEYHGYRYRIWEEDGYWHWQLMIDDDSTVTSFDREGSPAFGGKDSQGKALQAVKAAILRLERIGF